MDFKYEELNVDFVRKIPVDLSKSSEFMCILRMIVQAQESGKENLKTTIGGAFMVAELRKRGFQMTNRGGGAYTISWGEES